MSANARPVVRTGKRKSKLESHSRDHVEVNQINLL